MNLKKNSFLSAALLAMLPIFFQSCQLQDAKAPKREYVTVYAESYTNLDSIIYLKFTNELNIHVLLKVIHHDSMLERIKREKFNCEADLILLNDYESLSKAREMGLFRPVESPTLEQNIDANFRLLKNNWVSLSKSPLILVYNKNYLSKDTIQTYHQLLDPKWKGKICFQDNKNRSITSFRSTIRLILKEKADSFLVNLNRQSKLSFSGDDTEQLNRISRGDAFLSIVRLSSLAAYHDPESKKFNAKNLNVQAIFPNQRKKGCYTTVTGAGVYRYARNPGNAVRLLEFLSSQRAQYKYAASRYDYPILKGVSSLYLLEDYGKFRARFYRKRSK